MAKKPRRPLGSFLLQQDADKRQTNITAPKRHEESIAKELGGRRQPGSGCYEYAKGDVAGIEAGDFEFLTECKTTAGKSLRVEAAWLNKITTEAGPDRFPALAIRFEESVLNELASKQWLKGGKLVTVAEADWVAVPSSVLERMLNVIREACDDD